MNALTPIDIAARMSVYFIQDDRGRVKIGRSSDPEKRLAQLQTGASGCLSLARVVDGGAATERWLHRKFAHRHIRGEWFEYDPLMASVQVPDEVPSPPKVKPSQDSDLASFFDRASRLGLLSQRDADELTRFKAERNDTTSEGAAA